MQKYWKLVWFRLFGTLMLYSYYNALYYNKNKKYRIALSSSVEVYKGDINSKVFISKEFKEGYTKLILVEGYEYTNWCFYNFSTSKKELDFCKNGIVEVFGYVPKYFYFKITPTPL